MIIRISGISCKFLAILVLLFPILLQARNLELVEADFFDDAPLILTASRMSKPLDESPASVSVIDRQMIESSGVRELADIFRLVPGFIVGNFNGNTPVVTYQGLGGKFLRQIQVLIDGRSVIVPTWGGVPWSNLSLLVQDIERIEVIRGPNAVTYGANAFLATINIITRHAAEDIGAHYAITTGGGTNPETRDAYVRFGYQTESLEWRLSLGTLSDDGFESVNDSRETGKLNYRLDYQPNNSQLWSVLLGTSNTISGDGFDGEFDNYERDVETNNSYININWENIQDDSSTTIRLTHTRQEFIDSFWVDPDSGLIAFIDNGRISHRTDFEVFQTRDLSNDFRLVYGTNLRRDKLKSLLLFNDQEYHVVDTSRLFTSVEWQFDANWLLDFGTAIEESSLTDLEYSPRLSVLRKLGNSHTLRFVVSEARRNPILFEHSGSTFYNITIPAFSSNTDEEFWRGNPDIEPEEIISYEIGLRSQSIDKQLSSDFKLFSYEVTKIIAGKRLAENLIGAPIKTFENQYDVEVKGLELALKFSPINNLTFAGGASLIEAESNSGSAEASFPDYTAFLTAQYRWQSTHSLSASYYYIDEMSWDDTKDIIPPINKLDLRYAYTLDAASETQVELVGYNLIEDFSDYFPQNVNQKIIMLRISGGF